MVAAVGADGSVVMLAGVSRAAAASSSACSRYESVRVKFLPSE